VGPDTVARLKRHGIKSTWQLFGKVLSYVDGKTSTTDLCHKIYTYLDEVMDKHVNKHGPTIALFDKISLGIKPPHQLLDQGFIDKSTIPDGKLENFLGARIGTDESSLLRDGLVYGLGPISIARLQVNCHRLQLSN